MRGRGAKFMSALPFEDSVVEIISWSETYHYDQQYQIVDTEKRDWEANYAGGWTSRFMLAIPVNPWVHQHG